MVEIEGKVAAILDHDTIVINKGRSDGVLHGMSFLVGKVSFSITDPDTGEILETIDKEKAKYKVIEARDRIALLRREWSPPGSGATGLEAIDYLATRSSLVLKGVLRPSSLEFEVHVGDSARRVY